MPQIAKLMVRNPTTAAMDDLAEPNGRGLFADLEA